MPYRAACPRDARHVVPYDTLVHSVQMFGSQDASCCELFVRDAAGVGRWYTRSELSEALRRTTQYRAEVDRVVARLSDAAEHVLQNVH